MKQHGLSASRPWIWLSFTQHQADEISMVGSMMNLGARMASFFQMNPGSVYSIKMVTSVFDSNVQDNAPLPVADIVWTFLDTENVLLLLWPAHSSDLSPIENVWSMAGLSSYTTHYS
ncbi:hypothetical protein TNCV_146171 [Trichonephila clavipes]|nr:hypothetical protein TNCV_146171 [Trichonephila clavipes]